MKKFIRGRKSKITAIFLLVVAVFVLSIIFIQKNSDEQDLNKKTEELSVQLANEETCSDDSIDKLGVVYEANDDNSEKAKLAEQLAVCHGARQEHDLAAEWYLKSAENYGESGSTEEQEAMKQYAKHSESLVDFEAVVMPEGDNNTNEDRGPN